MVVMQAVSYSRVRNNLKSFMRQVNEDADVVYITSAKADDGAVLVSQTEYENLLENAYIQSVKANVDHIMNSWDELQYDGGLEHEWQ
jgi:antitoxin YefM